MRKKIIIGVSCLIILALLIALPDVGGPVALVAIIAAVIWWRKNKKAARTEAPPQLTVIKGGNAPPPSAPRYNALDVAKFENEFEKDIERWKRKIESAESKCGFDSSHESYNPDKYVTAVKKAISVCAEFKDFCYFYPGGEGYYETWEYETMQTLEKELEDFLANDYEEEKAAYLERRKRRKAQ